MWLVIAICGGASALMLTLAIRGRVVRAAADLRVAGENVSPDARWRVYPELLLADYNRAPERRQAAADIDRRLVLAARPSGLTGSQFLALSQLAAVATMTLIILFGIVGGFGVVGPIVFGTALAGVVWWLMRKQLEGWVAERQKAISREFPYFLDLAVLMLGAGANFGEVLQGYLRTAAKTRLAVDIRALEAEVRAGLSTDAGLALLESRIPSQDVVTVIRAIRQGIRMGTPLSRTFRDQAEAIRFRRSQRAERDAEELKVKLQGPTMLLMIAILLLVLGPALVSMTQSGV